MPGSGNLDLYPYHPDPLQAQLSPKTPSGQKSWRRVKKKNQFSLKKRSWEKAVECAPDNIFKSFIH